MNAEQIAHELGGAARSGTGWQCKCPAHEDRRPSLKLDDGPDGRVLWRCHAGCEQEAVAEALRARHLIGGNGNGKAHQSPFHLAKLGEPSATWTYRHADGRIAFTVARYDKPDGDKEMRPWLPSGKCKAAPAPRPLYRLPELLADKAKPVLVVEGEKCAEAAARTLRGYAVTTWAAGAKAESKTDFTPLAGRAVTIWPDADEPGRAVAKRIAGLIGGRMLEIEDRPEGWDIADAIAEGWTEDELLTFIEEHGHAVESESAEAPKKPHAPLELILGPQAARLRPDLFDAPPPPFPFVAEGILPQDVGTEPAAGGMGKTTRHLYEAVQIVLGRDLWGYRVLHPGAVLIVTAEDFRRLYEERLCQIVTACGLSPAERRRVLAGIFIEDLVGKNAHLVTADAGGNLAPTLIAESIIERYRGEGLALVEFDPLNLLGPGERFVNDGEAATISAVRPVAYELGCAVRLTHHVSKAVFRDRVVDMYAGRGGASSADNARFVWVSVAHSAEDANHYPPPAGCDQAIADGRLLRLHVPKISYGPPILRPIWVERDGYAFRRLEEPAAESQTETRERHIKGLADFITAELARGVKHTAKSLEAAGTGLTRTEVRAALYEALQVGSLAKVPLGKDEVQGGRDYYLRPGAVSARYPHD